MPAYPPASVGLNPILAEVVLDSASLVSNSATSTSFVDFHASATITFTVPVSGSVVVELLAETSIDTGASLNWGLYDSSDVAATDTNVGYTATGQNVIPGYFYHKITGLTPGASKTYKWRVRRSGGSALARTAYGSTSGGGFMRVRSIP